MSLSDENIVTKRPPSEAAQVTAKPSPGWMDSINPFSSKSQTKQDSQPALNDDSEQSTTKPRVRTRIVMRSSRDGLIFLLRKLRL